MLAVDYELGIPINRQIYDQLKCNIQLSGSEFELPSIKKLSDDLILAYDTVAWGYRRLEREGLIVRHRGKGFTIKAREKQT